MIDTLALPFSLYQKAKALAWDPQDIDLSQDRADWQHMSGRERDIILRLSAMFHTGELAVAHDLAPLLVATRRVGDLLEDEMFLTAQLFEEAKHVEWFDRWHTALGAAPMRVESDAYTRMFEFELPSALNRLLTDFADEALAEALCVYHMVIEGVLAETGYHGYRTALKDNDLMPGTVRGVELVQRDEARHIAFGLHALHRILARRPELRAFVDERLSHLLGLVFEIIADTFAPYGDDIPFNMQPSDFVMYASEQFDHRMTVLDRA